MPLRCKLLILVAVMLFTAAAPRRAAAAAAPPDAAIADASADAASDDRLRDYIVAWLRYAWGLGPDRVQVTVKGGEVVLAGSADSPEAIDQIVASVATFEGVDRVRDRLVVEPGAAPLEVEPAPRWRTWRLWRRPTPGRRSVRFPVGDLFAPPLADQKQPRFHTTYQRYRVDFGAFDVASVGYGDNFGLVRLPREREGDGWQIGISGAVFAIFNLDGESNDLLDADYLVGFPLSYRSGPWSARARLFHQSSHLGDEFLLSPQPGPPVTRINLSYEALEVLASWERGSARLYGGTVSILSSDTSLGRVRGQLGFEYRGHPRHWRTARFVLGVDVEAWNETRWDRDKSVKAGLLFRSPYGDARSIQVLLEYYEGHAPHGQFFNLIVEYFGAGIAYAF